MENKERINNFAPYLLLETLNKVLRQCIYVNITSCPSSTPNNAIYFGFGKSLAPLILLGKARLSNRLFLASKVLKADEPWCE